MCLLRGFLFREFLCWSVLSFFLSSFSFVCRLLMYRVSLWCGVVCLALHGDCLLSTSLMISLSLFSGLGWVGFVCDCDFIGVQMF